MKSVKLHSKLLVACVALVSVVASLKADYYQPNFFPIGLTGLNPTNKDYDNCPYGAVDIQPQWRWIPEESDNNEQDLIFKLGINCIGGQDANVRYIGSFDTTICRNQNNYLYKVCIPSFMDDGDSTNPEHIYIIIFTDITGILDSLSDSLDLED